MKRKTKHNPPRKKKPSFIKFSKVQQSLLNEVQFRQAREWNETLDSVYQELGIVEKILQAPLGTFSLRQDLSGLDVATPPPVAKRKKDEGKGPEFKVILKEKEDSKDN